MASESNYAFRGRINYQMNSGDNFRSALKNDKDDRILMVGQRRETSHDAANRAGRGMLTQFRHSPRSDRDRPISVRGFARKTLVEPLVRNGFMLNLPRLHRLWTRAQNPLCHHEQHEPERAQSPTNQTQDAPVTCAAKTSESVTRMSRNGLNDEVNRRANCHPMTN